MEILFLVCIFLPMKHDWDETKREAMMRDRGPDFASVVATQWGEAATVEGARGDYGDPGGHSQGGGGSGMTGKATGPGADDETREQGLMT